MTSISGGTLFVTDHVSKGGAPESYLDADNRNAFRQQRNVFIFNPQTKSWENDAVASLDVLRERVKPIYRQIAQRAEKHSLPLQIRLPALTTETNLHLRSVVGSYCITHEELKSALV